MKIALYFCAFLFNFCCWSQEKSDFEWLGLKGNVKSMDEIDYHIFEDKTIEERGKTSYTFNPKGIKSLVKYYKRYTNTKNILQQ